MTPAPRPLVREIEEAAKVVRETDDPTVYHWRDWQRMIDLWRLQHSPCYDRIRAALEAAEEMAEHADKATDAPGLWMAAKRYRAATRGE